LNLILDNTQVLVRAATALKPPKLYLCGFPKSGLHLADRMALALLQQNNPAKNWLGTNAWTIDRHRLEKLPFQLAKLRPGQFIKGHTGYLKSIEFLMAEVLRIGIVFVYRDLRDVAVSQAHHMISPSEDQFFPRKEYYRKMSAEEILLHVIEGDENIDGLFERWETFAGWLDCDWALCMPFERMINNRSLAANQFFDYVYDVALRDSGIDGFLDNRSGIRQYAVQGILTEMNVNPEISPTFRTGRIGNWKEEFTPKVTEAFKAHDNGWLVRLGYEKDDTWQ